MTDCRSLDRSWDLDLVVPELPAQGRWRGGPLAQRLRPGCETLLWHPGEGSRRITAGDGATTLRLEDTDLTLAQILLAIQVQPGAPGPLLGMGEITLEGVRGVVRFGAETIRFEGIRRIVIGGYSAYPARPTDGREPG